MRISQQKAREVAKELLSKKLQASQKLSDDFGNMVRDEYLKIIHTDVKNFYEKHPSYCKSRTEITITGNGFNHQTVSVQRVIADSNSYGSCFLQPDAKAAVKLLKFYNAQKKAKQDYEDAYQKVVATLISLGSYAKIKENFPEAEPFLPEPTKKELVNISEVRKLLK